MAHNWPNSKRVFLSCYFHEIYRVEEVGLKNLNYKINGFVNMWNLWQFLENWSFANNCLVKVWIWEFFITRYSYRYDYPRHSSFFLLPNPFLVRYKFPFSILRFFSTKLRRSVSQGNAFKKSKYPSPFFFVNKTIGSNNSLTLIEINSAF